jgi:hypothetical protein
MKDDAFVASASGKETKITFSLNVCSSPAGKKGEMNSRPSSSLCPISTVRYLSKPPDNRSLPGRSGAKDPSTTGSGMMLLEVVCLSGSDVTY